MSCSQNYRLMWVQGTKLGSFGRAVSALNGRASSEGIVTVPDGGQNGSLLISYSILFVCFH